VAINSVATREVQKLTFERTDYIEQEIVLKEQRKRVLIGYCVEGDRWRLEMYR